jgi:hypothetical protein
MKTKLGLAILALLIVIAVGFAARQLYGLMLFGRADQNFEQNSASSAPKHPK